jgi:hypothetical protein
MIKQTIPFFFFLSFFYNNNISFFLSFFLFLNFNIIYMLNKLPTTFSISFSISYKEVRSEVGEEEYISILYI